MRTPPSRTNPRAARCALEFKGKGSLLIAFEGLDGSGKSTQARILAESLGSDAVLLREPSDGPFGRAIREMAETARPRPVLEHKFFLKDREWDLKHNILPALGEGKTVVLDRYILSNLAYQGALGIPLMSIMADNVNFPWPDMTFVLTVDAQTALKRIRKSRKTLQLFETEGYLQSVGAILASVKLSKVMHIDGAGEANAIAGKISKQVDMLRRKG
jgi:dTMP kinase